jgi:hypothetical protein
MRSGAVKTETGWNVQDFALSLFNPNAEKLTVTWTMVSSDPAFVFANGQIGRYTKLIDLAPLSGTTDNVYISPAFEAAKPAWPVSPQTNFTGTVEFTSPKPFYLYLLPPTGIGESPDLTKAYFAAWGSPQGGDYYAHGGLRGVWDRDLRAFVIPYTIYWHNETNWYPYGCCSAVTVRNHTDRPVTYTVTHIPYYGGYYDPQTEEEVRLGPQEAQITLRGGEERQVRLPELYDWVPDRMYAFEGCLLVSPDKAEAAVGRTTVQLSILGNASETPLHAVFR